MDIIRDLIHVDDRERLFALLSTFSPEHNIGEITFRFYKNDGSIGYAYEKIYAKFGDDGQLVEIYGYGQDITERVLAEEKAKEQQALISHQNRLAQQGEMLNMIGHQWRQPLNQIALMQQVLRKQLESLEGVPLQAQQLIADSIKTIKFLSQTISDFKHFFSESKTQQVFRVDELLLESQNILDMRIAKHKITLRNDFATPESLTVLAYKSELSQVIHAILNNSIDVLAEKEGARMIIVSATADTKADTLGKQIIIRIEDNAGGIAEETLSHIFDPYFSTKKEKNGTGLGLYMSRMIMENSLNGEIEALNSAKGAAFLIKLPVDLPN